MICWCFILIYVKNFRKQVKVQQVWSEYPKNNAMMKVMPGVRLNIANINVAEVKVMPSA